MRLKAICRIIPLALNANAISTDFLSEQKTVVVRFECNVSDTSVCPHAQNAVLFAANAIEQTIVFSPNEPLRILTKFESFCNPVSYHQQDTGTTPLPPSSPINQTNGPLGIHTDPTLANQQAAYLREDLSPQDSVACRDGRLAECVPGGWFKLNLPAAIPRANPAERYPWAIPQSLFRHLRYQLNINNAKFQPRDVIARFNSDVNWFISGYHQQIQPDQYDLTYAIVHEFLHGLGMMNTAWAPPVGIDLDVLVPNPQMDSNNNVISWGDNQALGRHIMLRWTPGICFADLATRMNANANPKAFAGQEIPLDRLLMAFSQHDPEGYRMAQKFYAAATTPGSLAVWIPEARMHPSAHSSNLAGVPPLDTNSNESFQVFLETDSSQFRPGTTLTHFSSSYLQTSDFLFCGFPSKGITLEQKIAATRAPLHGFGPRLIGVLSTLGYTLTQVSLQIWHNELRAGREFIPGQYSTDFDTADSPAS